MASESTVPVRDDADIVVARQVGRQVAADAAFSETDQTLVATAISEIARNMVQYGGGGEMRFERIDADRRAGIRITAVDRGPGITDVERAMQDGYTTGKGLGLGLPGAKRLMDEFQVASKPGEGTTIVMTKWNR